MDSPYRRNLLALLHEHVAEICPDDALPSDRFLDLFRRHENRNTIRQHNVYLADLWCLFGPDFRRRLDAYYGAMAMPSMMSFAVYASDPRLIEEYYAQPYQIARERLDEPFTVLEIGGGITHGLIYEQLSRPGFCAGLTLVDLDAPYARFVEWFCARERIPFRHVLARAGDVTTLPGGPFDFVFAKDVFEHLHNPTAVLEEIARVISPGSVLALDLDDKGARVYQHVSPDLSDARKLAAHLGLMPFHRSGNLTLYEASAVAGGYQGSDERPISGGSGHGG